MTQSPNLKDSFGATRGRRDVTIAVIRKDSLITAVCTLMSLINPAIRLQVKWAYQPGKLF